MSRKLLSKTGNREPQQNYRIVTVSNGTKHSVGCSVPMITL